MKPKTQRLLQVGLAILLMGSCLHLTRIFRSSRQKNLEPQIIEMQDVMDVSKEKVYIKTSKLETKDFTYSISFCHCSRSIRANTARQVGDRKESTCSKFATYRGRNQKVFSYSYYSPYNNSQDENHNERYLKPIYKRATEIQKYFPGWFMRLYHNISSNDTEGNKWLCRVFCSQEHVDLCDVTNLPVFGNLMETVPIGRVWRFAVMGDPTISIFNSRDIDSWISVREVMAVKEWLTSNKTFHVMRDFPYHKAVMLAGLWGGKNEKKVEELARYRDEMFSEQVNYTFNFDQHLLKTFVWPNIEDDVMQHDSYTCQMVSHANSIPFPTKRTNNEFLGWDPTKKSQRLIVQYALCPIECRPPKHKDWDQC